MNSNRNCEGITRRDCVKAGVLGPLGLTLANWLDTKSKANERSSRAKACILLWLDGGPSHLETFDPKPQAPDEVRGPFGSISTNVPGIQLSEHLIQTSKICDKIAIIRSMTSPLGEHGLANQYLLTGYKPSSVLQYPSFGSVVSRVRSHSNALPPFVAIPEARNGGAGYLGSAHEPFETHGDPSKPDFKIQDLDFYPGIDSKRLHRRQEFLQSLNQTERQIENGLSPSSSGLDQAYRLVTSSEAKRAFDLSMESQAFRASYGPKSFGQSCLLARRLVERGVPFVTVTMTGWDTHENLSLHLRDGYSGAKVGVGLIPTFDLAFATLVRDLSERGMLDETLVIAMGEFGRTPKLNARGGRDHWPRAFSVAMAGGGVAGGQVYGASDRVGESPIDRPVTPNDLAKTIYALLGVDTDSELRTPDGRPVPINQGGQTIRELVRV